MSAVDEQQQSQSPAPDIEPADVDELGPADDDLEPDELDDDQADDVDEPNQGAAVDAADVEKANKQLDRVETYLERKREEIFGSDAGELVECELCTWSRTFGKRWPVTPPEQVREAVKIAIGLGTIDELNEYAGYQTCETCNGHGNVKTGSKVTSQLFRPCPSCGGRGFSSSVAGEEVAQPIGLSVVAIASDAGTGAPPSEPDFDMFGTPRGHPDYGKLAQYRETPISEWAHNLAPGA